jgi:hypothetical protein
VDTLFRACSLHVLNLLSLEDQIRFLGGSHTADLASHTHTPPHTFEFFFSNSKPFRNGLQNMDKGTRLVFSEKLGGRVSVGEK